MQRQTRHLYLAAALCGLLTGPAAGAGRVVDLKTTYYDGQKADETATVYFDQGRMRFDAEQAGRRMALVVRVDSQGEPVCWVMDIENDTYVELTKKSVGEVEMQIESARKALEEQIEAAPPAERERIRQMMKSQYGSVVGQKAKVEFKKIASGVKVSLWRCAQYESSMNGRKYEDIWTASAAEMGLVEGDLKLLGHMSALFAGVSQETNAFFQTGKSEKGGGFDGFPVVVVEYKDGKKYERSEVTGVRQENVDASLFELPKGARLQKLVE